MPKTAAKPKKKSKKVICKYESSGVKTSFGIILTLFIALVVAIVISVSAIQALKTNDSALSKAKLETFDHIASAFIQGNDITDNDIDEMYQMTGYGISDEDGVFYITFDFADPATADISVAEDGAITINNARHGIVYFWPSDTSISDYSRAYSYHDDDYHPGGIYVRL